MGSSTLTTFTSLLSFASVNTSATTSAATLWTSAGDFLIIFALFLFLLALAWQGGRAFILSFLISLYVGYALYTLFPYASYLPQTSPLMTLGESVGIFLLLTGITFFVLRRAVASDFISISFFGLIILALLATGFLLALAFNSFPFTILYTFTPAVTAIFGSPQFFFWWFSAPLLGLLFLVR